MRHSIRPEDTLDFLAACWLLVKEYMQIPWKTDVLILFGTLVGLNILLEWWGPTAAARQAP